MGGSVRHLEGHSPRGAAMAANLFAASLSLGQSPSNSGAGNPAAPAATAPPVTPAATLAAPSRIAPPRRIQTDSDVSQARFGQSGYPSSQQQCDQSCPPAPTKPQPATPAPVAPNYAPQYAPTYAPQYAPTYAPQYAPTYAPQYAPQYPQMVPMMPQYAAPAPPAAPGNFFLPPAAPPAAPPAPPAYAPQMVPMVPMAPAYPMPMMPAYAAPQPPAMVPAAALTNSSVSVPTSRASSRVRVRGPGPLASRLARFGERLTQLGRTRIETVQETELDTPRIQPMGGVATISTTGAVPVQQPQAPVAPPAAPPAAPPEAPTPSPQGQECHHKHPLFQHLLGDD